MARHERVRRAWRRRAAVGVVAAVGGAAVLAACGSADPGANTTLDSAQAFVASATAFRFESAMRSTYHFDLGEMTSDGAGGTDGAEGGDTTGPGPGWAGQPGSTTTDRTVTTGSWTTDGWEASDDGPFGHSEVRGFGNTIYTRDEFSGSTEWQMVELPPMSDQDVIDQLEAMGEVDDEEMASGSSVDLAAAVYLQGGGWTYGPMGDPRGYLDAISQLARPTVDGSAGGAVTLSAELTAPGDVEAAWGSPLPPGDVTLTLAEDGTPLAFTLRVEDAGDSFDLEVRFSEWNLPHEVLRPDPDQVDATPWIDEEAVAAVPGVQLLGPTDLPSGWTLDYVNVLTGDDTPEGCDQVELQWSQTIVDEPTDDDSFDYFGVYLLPLACATEADPTPFAVGEFAPLPSREGGYSVEVLVGDTVVQIDSTLTDEELAAIGRSLSATDVASLSAQAGQASFGMLTS